MNEGKNISKAIAVILVDDRQELKKKLVQLGLACSCTIDEMKDKDLADTIVEGIHNKELQLWFAEKIIGKPVVMKNSLVNEMLSKEKKDEYKSVITKASVDYKAEKGISDKSFQSSDVLMLSGITLMLFGAFAISYFGTKK